MALSRWQAYITDEDGNILAGATVTVAVETSGLSLAPLYSDRDGLVPLGNPITADADGFVYFHVAGGLYKVIVTNGEDTRTWRYIGIGTAGENDVEDVVALVLAGLDPELNAIAALADSGLIARTGAGTVAARTITGTASKVTVTNGDGVAGNPTLTIPDGVALVDPVITGTIKEDVYTITDGAAFEIDPGNGSIQLVTLGASRTPLATNFAAGESVTLMVNDGSAFTITWATIGVVWVGGLAPALATSGYSVIVLWKVGSTIYGTHVGDVA